MLAGVTAVDWEDAAVGPCDAGICLFIGDIGDNAVKRQDYRLLKVPEPELPAVVGATVGAPHERVDFYYADGKSYNCETLMLHPETGDAYLVIKAVGASVPVFCIDAKALVPALPARAKQSASLGRSASTSPSTVRDRLGGDAAVRAARGGVRIGGWRVRPGHRRFSLCEKRLRRSRSCHQPDPPRPPPPT